jgi:RNA polymerase sigma-70 factor (ECF subfamily)
LTAERIQNERDTIRLLSEGNREAFTSLYNLYADKLYYFALGLLKTEEDAENLTQEVFIKIWETRSRIDPDNSFNAYLFTIARNTIFNQHRKKLNEIAYLNHLELYPQVSEEGTESIYFFKELREQLDRCVDKLPPQQQRVFTLSRNDGFSHREIAREMGIAEKTIAAHMRLALKSLRTCLSLN